MLAFVCLPIFIILLYVPGYSLNAIPIASSLMGDTTNSSTLSRSHQYETTTTLSTHLAGTTSGAASLSETIIHTPIPSHFEAVAPLVVVDSKTRDDQKESLKTTRKNQASIEKATTLKTTTVPFPSFNEIQENSGKLEARDALQPTSSLFESSSIPTKASSSSSYSSVMSTSSTLSTSSTSTTSFVSIFYPAPTTTATESTTLNITSQTGTLAYLPCNVQQLVKKPVSWIRIRDGHILTVDETTFIADQRFQSMYSQSSERWSLQIKYVQAKDAGAYECQVSTEPKTSSRVNLFIVEPKTEVLGEYNRHVKAGSRVTLRCIISEALEPPMFINWFFNQKQIFLHNNNGWQTAVERDVPTKHSERNNTIASLIIPAVTKKDSGNYTCRPSNSESITVVLHVLNGEYSASAITSGTGTSTVTGTAQHFQQSLTMRIIFVMICLQISFLI